MFVYRIVFKEADGTIKETTTQPRANRSAAILDMGIAGTVIRQCGGKVISNTLMTGIEANPA